MKYRTSQAHETAKEARALGYKVGLTAKGHLRCKHPNGALVICSRDDGVRNARNSIAKLKNAAKDLPTSNA